MELKPHDKLKHFKGSIYEVICVGKHTETMEEMVVYTHDGDIWIRPLSMFDDTDDISTRPDNVTGQIHRFEKMED